MPRSPSLSLAVVGHVNVDRFLRVPRPLARDRTVPVIARFERLGGTAANIALGAARLGVPVGLAGRIGRDFPPPFLAALRRSGIDLGGLERVPGRETPTCTIVEDPRGETCVLIEQGPMDRSAATAPVPRAWLRRFDWLHLTTGEPKWLLRWAEAARALGVRVSVDPAQEVHYRWSAVALRRLLAGAEVLFGNAHEIDRVVSLLGHRRVEALLRHVPVIVRTDGARGAVAYHRAGVTTAASRPARRIATTVGAGDAFRAGFFHRWLSGATLSAALRAGNLAASRWVRGVGRPIDRAYR